MGLFGRKSKPQEPTDDDLTFMTVSDAQELRSLARAAFAEHGLEVTVHGDHAVDDAGREFGFWNVAVHCHESDRREWPTVVHDHVARVLASLDAPDPFEGLTPESAAAAAYARLYEVDALPDPSQYPHREFAPGIVEVIALDLPDTVSAFSHENAAALGGAERLRAAGVANLAALPVEQVQTVPGPRDSSFTVALGDSVYTGSLALLLPDLARRTTGEEPGELGWLLSVPNRHQAVWHLVRDASVIGALEGMARFTALGYSDAPSPVSPHVFWWNGSAYLPLTRVDDDGRLAIEVGPEFRSVLEAVGLVEE